MNIYSRDGVWCPAGERLDKCDALFLGDSIFRYLHHHIPDNIGSLVPAVRYLSGAKVATLTEECETLLSHHLKVCVIHVGTNNVKTQTDRTPEILAEYEDLVALVKRRSPNCEIVLSSVLPRYIDRRDKEHTHVEKSRKISEDNSQISELNSLLRDFCSSQKCLHFVCHDEEFWPLGQETVSPQLLALDGLHLSKKGISVLAQKLICQVEAFQSLAQSSEQASDYQPAVSATTLCYEEDFPILPPPVREPGKDSPYCPDPVLSVNKTDLSVSPWVATLKRISQREKGCKHKSATKGKTPRKSTHHSKTVLKKKYSLPSSKVSNMDIGNKGEKCEAKRVSKQQEWCTNRYSVLAIDEIPQLDDSTDQPPAAFNICNIHHKLSRLECAGGVVSRKFRLTKKTTKIFKLTKRKRPFRMVFRTPQNMSQTTQSQHPHNQNTESMQSQHTESQHTPSPSPHPTQSHHRQDKSSHNTQSHHT